LEGFDKASVECFDTEAEGIEGFYAAEVVLLGAN